MASLVTSITGIQNLTHLENFNADWNAFISVDLSNMTSLITVDLSDSEIPSDTGSPSLTSINLAGCTALEILRLDDNDFSGGFPDLSSCTSLRDIDFDQCGLLGDIDLSNISNLSDFDLSGNSDMTSVTISSAQPLWDLNLSGCDLPEAAVDAILVALSTNGIASGYVDVSGGTNAPPGAPGLAAKASLESNGWTVYVN
jgi:hypothetical protein